MDAKDFDGYFRGAVVEACSEVGYHQRGKSLWYEEEGVRAALLRTETRHQWPFAFTFVIGHSCLRDFQDRLPAPRSRSPSEYPIKLRPSEAARVLDAFRYEPWNLGRWPQDIMEDAQVERQLDSVADALVSITPRLAECLSERVVRDALIAQGEGAWCEQRWVEDYNRYLGD